MSEGEQRWAIPGSERVLLEGSVRLGGVDPNERIEVSVVLRAPVARAGSIEAAVDELPQYRRYLTRVAFPRPTVRAPTTSPWSKPLPTATALMSSR